MENILPTLLLDLIVISITFSVILMALIQKLKTLSFINKSWHIWFLNLILSFLVGIPFSITFYNLSLKDSIWVGLFSFIGASAIYEGLKNQNLINYKPSSISDTVTISSENEIKRDKNVSG